MLLSNIESLKRMTITALEKKNILNVRDMLLDIPRVYYDFREIRDLDTACRLKKMSAIKVVINKYKKSYMSGGRKASVLTAKCTCVLSNKPISITWIGMSHMESQIKTYTGKQVVVCGMVEYSLVYGYTMNTPYDMRLATLFPLSIVPVYSKYKGLSDDMRKRIVNELLDFHTKEMIPSELIKKHNLISYKDMMMGFHKPHDVQSFIRSKQRLEYEEMLYFAYQLRQSDRENDNITNLAMHRDSMQKKVIASLPYNLTESQENAIKGMLSEINSGKKLNVLLNGDVGAGKSIVIFLMMIAAAENGYQAVLMAPTVVLATQHYLELKKYAELCGLEVAMLSNNLKGKEKKSTYESIKDGTCKLIVGTHSVISDKVEYKNVALVITDEEQRFGRGQRNKLQEKAESDANVISVSATPIPGTMADTLYKNKKVYYLLPPSTKGQIQTAVVKNPITALNFAEKQIAEGRQCYAVCPLIEEKTNSPQGVASIESVYNLYMDYFQGKDIKIACVHGKTAPEDERRILDEYRNGKIDLLIATTIIEVGVSVQNASVMIIHNAERYGLSQLHQLRGRIGRGEYKGYCILVSDKKGENERLSIMENEINGFKIAEADLVNRGSGDLFGLEQSGFNKYIDLMLKNRKMFDAAKEDVLWCEEHDISLENFIMEYES